LPFSLNLLLILKELPSCVGTTTRLTFEEFQNLPEREDVHYELDDGELLMETSPAARHNLVRQRIAMSLTQFVEPKPLGIVLEEMDFRLGSDTVRNPDKASVTTEHLGKIDLDRSPDRRISRPCGRSYLP
jgi:Uma2 family endonuclease